MSYRSVRTALPALGVPARRSSAGSHRCAFCVWFVHPEQASKQGLHPGRIWPLSKSPWTMIHSLVSIPCASAVLTMSTLLPITRILNRSSPNCARAKNCVARAPGGICKLPSCDAVISIAAGLCAALFPTHYGAPDLTDKNVDYHVGYTLESVINTIREAVRAGDSCTLMLHLHIVATC